MANTSKPNLNPIQPFPQAADTLHEDGRWLWMPLLSEWRDITAKPEDRVRQHFIRTPVEHYGYTLAQMDQERRTQAGHKSPRADIVVWQSVASPARQSVGLLRRVVRQAGCSRNPPIR